MIDYSPEARERRYQEWLANQAAKIAREREERRALKRRPHPRPAAPAPPLPADEAARQAAGKAANDLLFGPE